MIEKIIENAEYKHNDVTMASRQKSKEVTAETLNSVKGAIGTYVGCPDDL